MKILHTVEFYHPSIGGMQEVVQRISELLVKYGHDVTVATTKMSDRQDCIINGVMIEEFDISGNAVRGMTGERGRYEKFLLDSHFDVIVNFAAQQWATDIALPLLAKIRSRKVFVPTGFSGLYAPEYHPYFQKMKVWMKSYDMNVFLSDDYRDVNFAKDNGIDNRILIPNGASEAEFSTTPKAEFREKLGIPVRDFLVLHVGSHTGLKGHGAAIRAFHQAKIRNATLLLVGQKSGGCSMRCVMMEKLFPLSFRRIRDRKRFMLRALSREDTVAAFHAADVFIFPSNVECSPIVLFECMASKTPFLTSEAGNAKEIASWSSAGLVIKCKRTAQGYVKIDCHDAANKLEHLYHDENLRFQLALNGHTAWKQKFTWELIAKQYEALYKSLLGESATVATASPSA